MILTVDMQVGGGGVGGSDRGEEEEVQRVYLFIVYVFLKYLNHLVQFVSTYSFNFNIRTDKQTHKT